MLEITYFFIKENLRIYLQYSISLFVSQTPLPVEEIYKNIKGILKYINAIVYFFIKEY